MIKLIKIGNLIYENIEPKTIDENGNEIWNVPSSVTELQKAMSDTLAWLEKQRIQEILDKYGYISLADIQFYASQNDAEAQSILSWYKAYDDAVWNWIDNDLQSYQTVEELLALDMRQVEEQIYQNSITASPLP